MRSDLLLAVSVAMMSSLASAQTQAQAQGVQQWTFINVGGEASAFRYNLEAFPHEQIAPGPAKLTVVELMPSVGVAFNKELALWAGYTRYEQIDPLAADQNHVWLQFAFERDVPAARFLARVRVEERFVDGQAGAATRVRVMLRGSVPLAEQWKLVLSNEFLYHAVGIGDVIKQGFDQNRLQLSVRFQATKWFSVEAGYLAQYTLSGMLNHIFVVNLGFKLPKPGDSGEPAPPPQAPALHAARSP